MAELSITEAIRLSPIGRTRMYDHYIKNGIITVSVNSKGDKYIESSELFRVFGSAKDNPSTGQVQETPKENAARQGPSEQSEQNAVIQILREQLDKAEQREKEHLKRIDSLTLRLDAPAKRQSWLARIWHAKDGD